MKDGVVVASFTNIGHPFGMFEPQFERIVGVETDVVSAVHFLQTGRMQVSDISYVFSRL